MKVAVKPCSMITEEDLYSPRSSLEAWITTYPPASRENALTFTDESDERRAKRQRLAVELRRLRERAGISGRDLATRIHISQSKVSRIESGTVALPVPTVAAWADAVGADAETRTRLIAMTDSLFASGIHDFRTVIPIYGHSQGEIQKQEARASRIRVYQPSIVPGLLQTAEYARRMLELATIPYEDGNLAKALTGRVDRQSALYDAGRRFDFLITEAALRFLPGAGDLLAPQLDRISSLMTLTNVSIGIIPAGTAATIAVPAGFDMLDERDHRTVVTVEFLHANLVVTDADHIAHYERAWTALDSMAVQDDDAQALLGAIRRQIAEGGRRQNTRT
jgi:transcriptional regulator with XRE-family HTH domain